MCVLDMQQVYEHTRCSHVHAEASSYGSGVVLLDISPALADAKGYPIALQHAGFEFQLELDLSPDLKLTSASARVLLTKIEAGKAQGDEYFAGCNGQRTNTSTVRTEDGYS